MSASDFVTRGQALVASGQFQEAVKVCRLGLLGRPTTVEGRIVLGQALLALKRYDEVLAEMRVALDLDHGSVPAQTLKGEALLKKGDVAAATEQLRKAQSLAPSDPRLHELLAEAHRSSKQPALSSSHPAVGFVGAEPSESHTKHYPNHGADQEPTGDDPVGSYTRPTSLSAPTSKKRSTQVSAQVPAVTGTDAKSITLPSAEVLAIGDKSGTMEAELLEDDDDFGEVAEPPPSDMFRAIASGTALNSARAQAKPGAQGRPLAQSLSTSAQLARGKQRSRGEVSAVELDSADLVLDDSQVSEIPEIDEEHETKDRPRYDRAELEQPSRSARGMRPGPGTAVRNAVQLPSGPIDEVPSIAVASRRTEIAQAAVPMPDPAPPRGMIAAAMPTMAAVPSPSARMSAAQQASANAVDALFAAEPPPPAAQPAWARSTVVAGSPQQVMQNGRPEEIDPRIAALVSGGAATGEGAPAVAFDQSSISKQKPPKARRGRSKLAIALWVLIGGGVIGGGVFAGFQIREMRLQKQIDAARTQSSDLAKSDTYKGWSGARDRLAGIAQASATVDNRAALARARGVLAFEFGDGMAATQSAIQKLQGQGGLDAAIAQAYLALAESDAKAAKSAADRAVELGPTDAAALYVAGQASLLGGDHKKAIAELKSAHDRDARPLYAVALGRAIGSTNAWTEALAAVERALGAMPDHPAALIEKAFLLRGAGMVAKNNGPTSEIRLALNRLIQEGAQPLAQQTRGVSRSQVALANLALAHIDFALGDATAAFAALKAAAEVQLDEQRFSEEALDTLYLFNELQKAKTTAGRLFKQWPTSRRARITNSLVLLGLGEAREALDSLERNPDAIATPRGLAVRGQAKLALGDLVGARADFEGALKKAATLELALVGKAWVDIAEGDVEEARKAIEAKFKPETASVALATVWAAIQRRSDQQPARDAGKALLEKLVKGPNYPDVPRAHLELGRFYRDAGDGRAARVAFNEAVNGGISDAKLELAESQIDDHDPQGGRETLDGMVAALKDAASPTLLIAAGRARMLVGDHAGAVELLDRAEKAPLVVRWTLDRERGRLALRRGQIAEASTFLTRALDAADVDPETVLLAADTAISDYKAQTALVDKVKAVTAKRLRGTAEEMIVAGKLALGADQYKEALAAYTAANKLLGDKASARRLAQAHFGLAVTAYYMENTTEMSRQLDVALPEDPTLYVAYLFAAQAAERNPKSAIIFAQKAVQYNPDSVDGWVMFGTAAAALAKRADLNKAIAEVTRLAPGSEPLQRLQALQR